MGLKAEEGSCRKASLQLRKLLSRRRKHKLPINRSLIRSTILFRMDDKEDLTRVPALHRCGFFVSVVLALSISALSMSMMSNVVHAASVVELSASDGSRVCPTYLTGPGVSSTEWNATTSTCTVIAQPNITPTLCIAAASPCAGAAIDEFIIDSGVTLVMQRQAGASTLSLLCVYSTLENYGMVEGGSICDYGTITNYGKIGVPVGNFFQTLPFNGKGIFDNMVGGVFVNNYTLSDWGTIVNYGTIYNRGQFGDDNQYYHETFTNNGTFIGSAPCFALQECRTSFGVYNITSSGTTIDDTIGTGIAVTVTEATGTNVAVVTQNQTIASPVGLGALNVSSPIFYDVMISGISEGTARICVTNSYVTPSMAGGMQYWNGTSWVSASNQTVDTSSFSLNQTVSGSSSLLSLCGDVPVVALSGTPIGAGIPTSSNPPSAQPPPSNPPSPNTPSPQTPPNATCALTNLNCSLVLQVTFITVLALAAVFAIISLHKRSNNDPARSSRISSSILSARCVGERSLRGLAHR